MKATWNGRTIAESANTVVVDGNHYFPMDAVDASTLKTSETTSVCGWKGTANDYHIEVDGETNADAVWVYREPKEAAQGIKGHVAFWTGVQVSE